MEFQNILLSALVMLAVLFFVILLIRPELIYGTFQRTEFPGTVEIFGEPEITIPEPDDVGGDIKNYQVNFKADLIFKGDFAVLEGAGVIDIVPLISYKGHQVKGFVDGEPTFRIDQSRDYEASIDATIITPKPPLRVLDANYYDGIMNKSQIFSMEDQGQFLIDLENVGKTSIERYICSDVELPIGINIGSLCEATCYTFFRFQCLVRNEPETKFERLEGGCDTSECQKTVKCGNGIIDVNVFATDCNTGSAIVGIEVSGGTTSVEKLGEKFEISFWRDGDCVDNENEYDDLRVSCGNDFLGGPYTFRYIPSELLD